MGVAFYALAMDRKHPFSQGEAVATYIRNLEGFDDANLIGCLDYAMQSVAAHIERPIYHPESRAFRTFVDWGEGRKEVGLEQVFRDARALAEREGKPAILMFAYSPVTIIPGEIIRLSGGFVATHIKSFEGAIVGDENFYIYRVEETDTF